MQWGMIGGIKRMLPGFCSFDVWEWDTECASRYEVLESRAIHPVIQILTSPDHKYIVLTLHC